MILPIVAITNTNATQSLLRSLSVKGGLCAAGDWQLTVKDKAKQLIRQDRDAMRTHKLKQQYPNPRDLMKRSFTG